MGFSFRVHEGDGGNRFRRLKIQCTMNKKEWSVNNTMAFNLRRAFDSRYGHIGDKRFVPDVAGYFFRLRPSLGL